MIYILCSHIAEGINIIIFSVRKLSKIRIERMEECFSTFPIALTIRKRVSIINVIPMLFVLVSDII